MHADPALSDSYVPPGPAFKACLVLALAAGGALIVPVHYLTPRTVAGTEKQENRSDVVHFVPTKPDKSTGPIQIASAAPPFEPMAALAPMPAEPMPFEPMPFEPMPLEPMPVEPTSNQALVSVEEAPWYLEQPPVIEAAPTPIEQVPTADETYVFQDEPAPAIAADDPVPPPPIEAAQPEAVAQPEATQPEIAQAEEPQPAAPLPAVAVQPTPSPSDASAPPMPALDIDAMPMPVPATTAMQEPAPVVDAPPIAVAPVDERRGITCTSPVPEPIAASPLRPMTQQPMQSMQRQTAQPYAQPSARPYAQPARPAAPQPQPVRQSFNHPGYASPYTW